MQLLIRKVAKGRGRMETNVNVLTRLIFYLVTSKRGLKYSTTQILQIILAPSFFLAPGSLSYSWEFTNVLPQEKKRSSAHWDMSIQIYQYFCPQISVQEDLKALCIYPEFTSAWTVNEQAQVYSACTLALVTHGRRLNVKQICVVSSWDLLDR